MTTAGRWTLKEGFRNLDTICSSLHARSFDDRPRLLILAARLIVATAAVFVAAYVDPSPFMFRAKERVCPALPPRRGNNNC